MNWGKRLRRFRHRHFGVAAQACGTLVFIPALLSAPKGSGAWLAVEVAAIVLLTAAFVMQLRHRTGPL